MPGFGARETVARNETRLWTGGDGLTLRHFLEHAVEQPAQDHRYERPVVDDAMGRLPLVGLEDQGVDVDDAIDELRRLDIVDAGTALEVAEDRLIAPGLDRGQRTPPHVGG